MNEGCSLRSGLDRRMGEVEKRGKGEEEKERGKGEAEQM